MRGLARHFDQVQKNSTFTNRYWRWGFSIQNIRENIFFGSCNLENKASRYAGYNIEYFNPHNALLYLLTFGGIISVILLIMLLWSISKCRKKYVLLMTGMMSVTGLMESNISPTSTVFLMLIAITIYFIKIEEKYYCVQNKLSN